MNEMTPAIDPARSALLVMDYQAAIVGSITGSAELLARVAAAISTARDRGVQIGYVRVALNDSDYAAIPDTNKGFTQAAASRRLHVEAPELAIHDAVAPEPGDVSLRVRLAWARSRPPT